MRPTRAIAGAVLGATLAGALLIVACNRAGEVEQPEATEQPQATFSTQPANVQRMEWKSLPSEDGQVVLANHNVLLGAPLVSDDGRKLLFRADFRAYTDDPLFPPESAPGEAYFADLDMQALLAFPAEQFRLIPSDDFSQFVYGRYSTSGLSIYLMDPEKGTLEQLAQTGSIDAKYDFSGDKLVYVDGKAGYTIGEDGSITVEVAGPNTTDHEVYVLDLKTGRSKNISNNPDRFDTLPRISRNGKVVYLSIQDNNPDVFLADLSKGGSPVNITNSKDGKGQLSISANGRLVSYLSKEAKGAFRIVVYDTDKKKVAYTSEPANYRSLEIFPAGDKVAVIEEEPLQPGTQEAPAGPQYRLKIIGIPSGETETLPGNIRYFTISRPDGRYIGYAEVGDTMEKRVPISVTDAGFEYGTWEDVGYRGYIREVGR